MSFLVPVFVPFVCFCSKSARIGRLPCLKLIGTAPGSGSQGAVWQKKWWGKVRRQKPEKGSEWKSRTRKDLASHLGLE
jgi:hypothetical protein